MAAEGNNSKTLKLLSRDCKSSRTYLKWLLHEVKICLFFLKSRFFDLWASIHVFLLCYYLLLLLFSLLNTVMFLNSSLDQNDMLYNLKGRILPQVILHLHLIYSREWQACNPQHEHYRRKEKVALKKYQRQFVHLLGIAIMLILCKLTCPQATLICCFQALYERSSQNLGIKLSKLSRKNKVR